MSTGAQIIGLIGWILVVFGTAAFGAFASVRAGDFYAGLNRPSWAPPARLFGPVWTVLYCLMAVAVWLVWRREGFAGAAGALSIFVAQLFFNGLWSWLFFRWRRGAWAFVDILLLSISIAGTIAGFWAIKPVAGALLIPYLLWASYAAALNISVWRRNPAVLGRSSRP